MTKVEPVKCPVNFDKLNLGALRKYQYRFRLGLGKDGRPPMLERADLIEAIKRHFMQEMQVNYHDEIGKFLSLKREETRNEPLYAGNRRVRQARNNNNNNANNANGNGGGANGNNGAGHANNATNSRQ